jgi:hypothetical protein
MSVLAAWAVVAIGTGALAEGPSRPKGPDELPQRLSGAWKITLCVRGTHCWLRLESLATGEIHTLSRYRYGWGEHRDEADRLVAPAAVVSGVQWDQDLYYEFVDRNPWDRLLSLVVSNPVVYRGQGEAHGYNSVTNNCATYVRDAWQFYGGRRYDMLVPHLPSDLRDAIIRSHPKLRVAWQKRRKSAR